MKRGFEPDLVTVTTLLRGLCLNGKVFIAIKVFDKMTEIRFQSNESICRILINSLCKIHKIDFAIELRRRMIYAANVITYSVITHALCKDGSVDEAIKMFFEMIGKRICLDVVVYGSLINGLCGLNRLKEVVDFFMRWSVKEFLQI
ncbi:hypothetical protein LWI28_008134 [Acer negundo]|uniref:Pentatricopeptide repeat-containing protein n=1 Tax=Acer negundo TaxID=4023 RepID=A0AAD5JVW3_ACENE|nr:hypothetical protein LWI28_008134 [Acer negundo]